MGEKKCEHNRGGYCRQPIEASPVNNMTPEERGYENGYRDGVLTAQCDNEALINHNNNLALEIERLEEKMLRIIRGKFAQICSYCGWESSVGGWDELQKHILVCPYHPVSILTKQVNDLARENIEYRDMKWDAVRRQTTEEIIAFIAGGSFLSDQSPPRLYGFAVITAEIIRAIRETEKLP